MTLSLDQIGPPIGPIGCIPVGQSFPMLRIKHWSKSLLSAKGVRLRILLVPLILAAGFPVADAAEIRLKDGSVVYGDVKKMIDGEDLVVDTKHMDDVEIDWEAIVEIREAGLVVVQLLDGRRVTGRLSLDEGEVLIEGQQSTTAKQANVFTVDDSKETFWGAIKLNVDLGMNVVRGSNRVTQISSALGARYDAEKFETSINATTIVNEQTVGQDTRRRTLAGDYRHILSNNWSIGGLAQYESDELQGLDSRTLLGVVVGKRLVNQRRHRFSLGAGVAVNSEDYEGAPGSESTEGLLGVAYRLRSAVDLDAALLVLPSLEQGDRVRAQFDAALSVDLISDLDFKLTFYDRYDSEPPFGNDKSDYGVTLGLSWSK